METGSQRQPEAVAPGPALCALCSALGNVTLQGERGASDGATGTRSVEPTLVGFPLTFPCSFCSSCL